MRGRGRQAGENWGKGRTRRKEGMVGPGCEREKGKCGKKER